MKLKKIALIVLLIAVIAAAAVVAAIRVQSELKGPPLLLDQKFDKIDMKSFEIVSETLRDWNTKYTPDASGHYKNPKTGQYTMVDVMKCASCGQLIPVPDMPLELRSNPELVKARGRGMREAALAMMAAREKFERNYKCPKCGRNAYPPPANPIPPKSK
jgi:hypothetical protein